MSERPSYSEPDNHELTPAPEPSAEPTMSRRAFLKAAIAGAFGIAAAGFSTEHEAQANESLTNEFEIIEAKSIADKIEFQQFREPPAKMKQLVDDIIAFNAATEADISSIMGGLPGSKQAEEAVARVREKKVELWKKVSHRFNCQAPYSEHNFNQAMFYDLPRLLAPYGIATFFQLNTRSNSDDSKFMLTSADFSFYKVNKIDHFTPNDDTGEPIPVIQLDDNNRYENSPPFHVTGGEVAGMANYGVIFHGKQGYRKSIDSLIASANEGGRGEISGIEQKVLNYIASNSDQVTAAIEVAKSFVLRKIAEAGITDEEAIEPLLTHEAGHIRNFDLEKSAIPEQTSNPLQSKCDIANWSANFEADARLYCLRHTKRPDVVLATLLQELEPSNNDMKEVSVIVPSSWVINRLIAEILDNETLMDPRFAGSGLSQKVMAVISLPRLLEDRARLNQILDKLIKQKREQGQVKFFEQTKSSDQASTDKTAPIQESAPSSKKSLAIGTTIGLGLITIAAAGLIRRRGADLKRKQEEAEKTKSQPAKPTRKKR